MSAASEMSYTGIADYLRAWAAHIRSGGPITVSLIQAEKLNRAADIIMRISPQAEDNRGRTEPAPVDLRTAALAVSDSLSAMVAHNMWIPDRLDQAWQQLTRSLEQPRWPSSETLLFYEVEQAIKDFDRDQFMDWLEKKRLTATARP